MFIFQSLSDLITLPHGGIAAPARKEPQLQITWAPVGMPLHLIAGVAALLPQGRIDRPVEHMAKWIDLRKYQGEVC